MIVLDTTVLVYVRARRRDRAEAALLARDYLDLLAPLLVVGEDDLQQGLRRYECSERWVARLLER